MHMKASGPSMEIERVLDHIRSKLKEEVKQNNEVVIKINEFVVRGKNRAKKEALRSASFSITRPVCFELDAFDLEVLEDTSSHAQDCSSSSRDNVVPREEMTMKDCYYGTCIINSGFPANVSMLGVVVLYTRSNCQIQVLHKDFQITGREKIHPNGSGTASKIWRSLIHPLEWRVNKEGVPYTYPWLLFRQGGEKGTRYNLYDPVTNLTYSITIPEFEGCEVRFSNKGWLLVTKSPTSILFFQPFTRTRIQVPDLRQMEAYLGQGDNNCIEITVHSATFPNPSFTNPVSDGDSLYYLGENGSAYVSNFSQTMKAIHIEELISVFVDQGRGTHVVKLDKRVPLKRLEKEITYLSQTTCLVGQGKEQKIKNTVEMSMFLDNEKYQVYKREGGGYLQISHLYHTREFLSATWVQPLLLPHMQPTF
ncbi:hypothetical protein Gogos_007557 [Gossypium gossypioides]|uniref:KIB1-4 beta-propeller domain-containing protein n=1 Tax=Gossypium gossypioides TaxID=34282 RepID=A0A7J9C914_GOSGO|nr:hypothetical protein [Gossypium gossypioides]